MTTEPCPDCDRFIRVNAESCACGWTRPKSIRVDLYPRDKMRERQQQADDYCAKLGLVTVEDKRKWLLENKLKVRRVA